MLYSSLEGPNPYASSSVGWGRLIWFPGIIQLGPQGWPCLPLLAVAVADRLPGLCLSSRASSRTALGRQGGGRYRGPREPDQWPREWWGWWPNINPQGWWFFTKILKVRWFVNITLDSEISINFRFKKKATKTPYLKKHKHKKTAPVVLRDDVFLQVVDSQRLLLMAENPEDVVKKLESEAADGIWKTQSVEPDFSLRNIFGEYFFKCLWGMFSLGNILF